MSFFPDFVSPKMNIKGIGNKKKMERKKQMKQIKRAVKDQHSFSFDIGKIIQHTQFIPQAKGTAWLSSLSSLLHNNIGC